MVSGNNEHNFEDPDHAGFVAPGLVDRLQEFPFEEIYHRTDGEVQPTNHYCETAYREAALKLLPVLDQILSFVMSHENPRMACWIAALALGRISLTEGASQSDIAEKFLVTKAAVSKATKILQARLGNSIEGLPTMPAQREKEACQKMAQARNEQINHHHKNEN